MFPPTDQFFNTRVPMMFNLAKTAWDNRRYVANAKLASLAYAKSNYNWLSRWREKALFKRLPVTRDACILTVTGFDTFARKSSRFSTVLQTAYEIRVMLLNPASRGARLRVDSMPPERSGFGSFCEEVEASISYLSALRRTGKKVTLKFYDHQPFWKVVVLGDHVWVQYCHGGCEIKQTPEYVFALHHRNPTSGLFVPFYMYFLEKWGEHHHPEFDFDSRELVYRDATGKETGRRPFSIPPVYGTDAAVTNASRPVAGNKSVDAEDAEERKERSQKKTREMNV